MKKSITFFRIGSIILILLGAIHLMAHFTMRPSDAALDKLLADMENYKIELLGEHNLLKFYFGFSVMMGFLLIALGILNLFFSKLINKAAIYATIIILVIAFIIAFNYFHVLAFGFIFISILCYIISLIVYHRN